jgi:predicted transcriptional regulator of viral defense system
LNRHISTIKYNSALKTLGPRAAQLFTELNARRRSTFTLIDVKAITGLSAASARNLARHAQQRGLITRLKPGLYNLVPFELGWETEHVDSPYLIAKELVGDAPYFLSHGTAMELHRMVTQPIFTVYVSCTHRIRPQTVGGYDFRFIHITEMRAFGLTKHWIDKEHFVMISDIERTIIDGLMHPAFTGGITEVAKGLWMKRGALKYDRLVDYALQIKVGAVVRRLGFLLEYYRLVDGPTLEPLRARLTRTYQCLDPLLSPEGPHTARWRLQLNITPEELDIVRFS